MNHVDIPLTQQRYATTSIHEYAPPRFQGDGVIESDISVETGSGRPSDAALRR